MLTSFGGGRKFRSRKPSRVTPEIAVWLRISAIRMVILVLFGILAIQLWRLQVVEAKTYQTRAESNRIRVQTIPPPRGVIFDRGGKPLVRNIASFAVTVTPVDLPVEEQAVVAGRLAKLLGMRPEEVEKPIAQRRLRRDLFNSVLIKSNVEETTAFMIEENRSLLPGVEVQVEAVRQYLGGPLYSHLLGYTGRVTDEEYQYLEAAGYGINERVGKTGLELSLEPVLRGKTGRKQIIADATGRQVGELESIPPASGNNLVLTIDSDLQQKVSEYVKEFMGESKYAVGIVANIKTGEILAFVSLPGYDNNMFSNPISDADWGTLLNSPQRPLVNHGISDAFPPGSIFKLVTASAALQEKVAVPETTIFSKGYLEIPSDLDPRIKYIFPDWAAHGALNFREAIAKSGDVYFYQLGGGFEDFVGLGVDRLASYARAFGLGEKTGVDLPGEVEGNVPTPQWKVLDRDEQWYKGDTYNMSIGQGFTTVTPLQMIMLLCSFANGGDLLKPQIIKAVVDSNRNVIQSFDRVVRRRVPVSKENLNEVLAGMQYGVDWIGGTARDAAVPGMSIAAKSGTAEFGHRDLATGQYEFKHGWAYAEGPVENPEIAVLVFHERGGGPQTAVPAVGKILRYYFNGTR